MSEHRTQLLAQMRKTPEYDLGYLEGQVAMKNSISPVFLAFMLVTGLGVIVLAYLTLR